MIGGAGCGWTASIKSMQRMDRGRGLDGWICSSSGARALRRALKIDTIGGGWPGTRRRTYI